MSGGHVMEGDPLLSVEACTLRALDGWGFSDVPRSAHAKAGDPLLSIENRALHALSVPTPADEEPVRAAIPPPPDSLQARPADLGVAPLPPHAAVVHEVPVARARTRRRWKFVPLVGAGAVAVVVGGGAAVAFLSPPGAHGTGDSAPLIAGGPVTDAITATTGTNDLLPGSTGAVSFTVHNATGSSVTFDTVGAGTQVVSDNTALCASRYVSIAQTLPYTLPAPVTLSPGATSATQSIDGLVALATDAPSSCQGVSFTVTFSLSGRAS